MIVDVGDGLNLFNLINTLIDVAGIHTGPEVARTTSCAGTLTLTLTAGSLSHQSGRGRLQCEYKNLDLPDLGDKWQANGPGCTDTRMRKEIDNAIR